MANNIGCSILTGLAIPSCIFSPGGVQSIYIAHVSGLDDNSYTYDTNDVIQTFTCGDFFEFDSVFETAEYTQKEVKDLKTGSIYYEQEINILFQKNSALKRKLFLQLINTNQVIAIVQDFNDLYWLFGKQNYLSINDSTHGSGKAMGDFNGSNITLHGLENYPAYNVINSAFTISPTQITY